MSGAHVLIAVQDDGVGMRKKEKSNGNKNTKEKYRGESTGNRERMRDKEPDVSAGAKRVHGLDIVNAQLVLQYGLQARLRIFSREGQGTLVAFRLPF